MEGEFLTRAAVLEISGEILAAREGLLCNKALVVKRSAQQWRFFSDCIDRLVFPGSASEFDQADSRRLVSLKFEVENKLRRYYERPGKPVDYVFSWRTRGISRAILREKNIRISAGIVSLSGRSLLKRQTCRRRTRMLFRRF